MKIRTCFRCGMHETSDRIDFDKFMICKACRSSEQKMHINWFKRYEKLKKILNHYKKKSKNNYDCIVPISGGKDSAFQLYLVTKVFDMKPLAVTFSHNWFTKIGRQNLKNMTERLSVDLIEFTPNRELVNKLAKKSISKIGDACWHCHTGVDAFPLQASVKFNIPLIIYGESVAEVSGKATYFDKPNYSIDYWLKYSSKVKPDGMLDKNISKKDINIFQWPSIKDLKKTKTKRIHLADYIFWDAERQTEFIKEHLGWKEDHVEGTYKKYKSVECIMPGVHDYSKYLKRGFGRGTDFASQDARAGLLNMDEMISIASKYDKMRPKILDYFLNITGLSETEFEKQIEKKREGKALLLPKSSKMTTTNELKDSEFSKSLDEFVIENSNNQNWKRKIEKIQKKILFPVFFSKNVNSKTFKKIQNKTSIRNLEMQSISERRNLVALKKVTVQEITCNYLDKINKFEKKINSFSSINFDLAIDNSKLIDKNLDFSEHLNSTLTGSVAGIKDIFNTSDYKTQMGSKVWKDFHAGNDARCIYNLRNNNSLILGKTNTAEFGIDEPPKTKNPHNLNYLVGTSSSGSAAAVSCRLVSFALGTQTAASTTRPSSYTGIYGFKPTFGTIPRTGVLKTCDHLDHITIMANYAEDIKEVFDVIRVNGHNYPNINKLLEKSKEVNLENKNLKVGFVKTHTWKYASEYVKTSMINLVSKIKENKIDISELELPQEFNEIHEIHDKIFSKSVSYYFNDEFKRKKSKLGQKTIKKIKNGVKISTNEFEDCLNKKLLIERKLQTIFQNYDFIICHSTAEIAPKSEFTKEKNDPSLMWAFTGNPSINIPHFSYNKMPIGFQIVGRKYDDYKIFKFIKILQDEKLINCSSPIPKILK